MHDVLSKKRHEGSSIHSQMSSCQSEWLPWEPKTRRSTSQYSVLLKTCLRAEEAGLVDRVARCGLFACMKWKWTRGRTGTKRQ